MSVSEPEVMEPEVESPETAMEPSGGRVIANREGGSDRDSLLTDAMRVEGLTLAERLLLMEKIEGIYVERQKAAAEREFFAALSAFQRECPVIDKKRPVYNKDGTKIRYYYADLGDIVKQVSPLLASHGLSFDFSDSTVIPFEENLGGPYMELTCNVHHSGGHSRGFPYRVLIENNEYMSATQHGGEANSYARRYGFTNAFGILTADNDFDGNDPGRITPNQAREFRKPVRQPQPTPSAQKAANSQTEKRQIEPATDEADAVDEKTGKGIADAMKHGTLSVRHFTERFPKLTRLGEIKKADVQVVLSWIADPQHN